MSNKKDGLLMKISEKLDYFEDKPHKIERDRSEFIDLIIKYGHECAEEAYANVERENDVTRIR
jgi:hypothetical protein